ncbi:MAG: spore maturation protein A [Acutalibacteraceae bacterium]|nr:spore maturation protein A [Acutalibacteraceae bacterium]
MMNIIWSILLIIAIIFGILSGNGNEIADSVLNSGNSAIKLLLTLAGSMSIWSGIMAIADKCGITKALSILFSPILKFLFPDYKNNEKVMNAVSTNITANLIGIGNAATPAGLKAVAAMHNGESTANRSMSTFIVMNTSSIQIVPTTIAALRLSANSKAPMEIAPCIWISSLTALIVGITATKLFSRKMK